MYTFTTVLITLLVAHTVADHWIQTQHQADHKGLPGPAGRYACAKHVATYTATGLAMIAAVSVIAALRWQQPLDLHPATLAAGTAVSAITHYIADRRTPLKRIAVALGSGPFYALGAPRPGRDDNPTLGGAYALDQSWHWLWLFVSALIIAW